MRLQQLFRDYNSYFVTRNAGLLLSVPVGVMTETVPLVASVKTVAVI